MLHRTDIQPLGSFHPHTVALSRLIIFATPCNGLQHHAKYLNINVLHGIALGPNVQECYRAKIMGSEGCRLAPKFFHAGGAVTENSAGPPLILVALSVVPYTPARRRSRFIAKLEVTP